MSIILNECLVNHVALKCRDLVLVENNSMEHEGNWKLGTKNQMITFANSDKKR